MDEHHGSGFEDFSVDMGDFEVAKKREYHNCLWECTEGGSIDQRPLVHNGRIFFGSFNHRFYALDAKTGMQAWSFEAQDRIGLCSPVLYKNAVIFGSYDYNVYCLDTETGRLLWKFRTHGEIASTGAISDGVYYVTARDHNMYAISCDNGALLWKFRTQKPSVSVPTIHGDRIFFGSSDRNLYCIEKRTGNLIWKLLTDEEIICIAPFMIVDNLIYAGTMGTMMYAVDINNGEVAWKQSFGDYGITRGQVVLKGMLVQPTQIGMLYAFTPDGKIIWKVSSNHAFSSVATDGERIYTGSEDLHYHCFDANGKPVWKFKMEGPVWQPGAIHNGIVYVGSYDCNLYALDALKGTMLWKFRCPGAPSTYPPIRSFFEVSIKLSGRKFEDEQGKNYELRLEGEDEEAAGAYKSHVTYRMSSQYAARGKYQRDADEEGL